MTARLSPPAQVRERLEAARAEGLSFGAAWRHVMVGLSWPSGGEERWDWLAALAETERAWQAAYECTDCPAMVLRGLLDVAA